MNSPRAARAAQPFALGSTLVKRYWMLAGWALGCAVPLASGAAQAQVEDYPECAGRVSTSSLRRAPVFLRAAAYDSAAESLRPHVELLVESVAIAMRRLPGAPPGGLRPADDILAWHQLGSLTLVVYADGRYSWRPDTARKPHLWRNEGVQLIERALADTRDSGELVFVPEGTVRDSATFRMGLYAPLVSTDGLVQPPVAHIQMAVFSLLVPWFKGVQAEYIPTPRYPELLIGPVEGTLTLQFSVDTLGRVEMSSVRDVWPSDRPRLTGDWGEYYRQFLMATRRAIRDARFKPAELGGCKVPHLAHQSYAFRVR